MSSTFPGNNLFSSHHLALALFSFDSTWATLHANLWDNFCLSDLHTKTNSFSTRRLRMISSHAWTGDLLFCDCPKEIKTSSIYWLLRCYVVTCDSQLKRKYSLQYLWGLCCHGIMIISEEKNLHKNILKIFFYFFFPSKEFFFPV
jgi:hypothetical protein